MSYRYMRVMVFFDLPVETAEDKRAYRKFRKSLLESGFLMIQQSVYSKLVLNATAAGAVMNAVRKKAPPAGIVQMLTVTEKQYNNIEFVVGETKSEVISSTDRLVIL